MAWHHLHKQSSLRTDLFPFSISSIRITLLQTPFSVMAPISIKGVQSFLFFLIITLVSAQSPQCPNTLGVYNPNLRTMCNNASTPPVLCYRLSRTSLTNALAKPTSLYPSTPPLSRAPLHPISLYPFRHPTRHSFQMGFQQGNVPCSSKSISRTTSAWPHCRSQRRC